MNLNLLASNTKALPWVQIALTILILVYSVTYDQSSTLWLVSVLMYCLIGCMGISIGYHRLLTHKSFKTSKFWERTCTFLGALAFTGSSIGWVGVHRQHHRHSDHEGDPHAPSVYGARMLLASYKFDANRWSVRYLVTDKFHVWMHKYYFGILLLWSSLWLTISPLLFMHVVLIPACISIWSSTISNYTNHKWGYTNFKTSDDSRNSWINAIFTFGEGWHNNHHARPGHYDFGYRWWEVDLGAVLVRMIRTSSK